MKLVDTHCHLACSEFKNKEEQIIKNAHEKNIELITCGTNFIDSKKSVELADQYEYVYACVGFAPHEIEKHKYDENELKLLLNHSKIVAVGECGLDYYYYSNKKEQIKIFNNQVNIAGEHNLPLVIHCRNSKESDNDAYNDLIDILKNNKNIKKGVIHSFSGNMKYAKTLVEMGYYLGFNGILTFKNANDIKKIIQNIPLDRILFETDSPYLAPIPMRGKINEPSFLPFIAEHAAILLKKNKDEISNITTKNAINLFNLKTYAN